MMRFSIRKNIKTVVVAGICILFTQVVVGQSLQKESPSIGFSFIGNIPKRIEINPYYISNPVSTGVFAANSLGFEMRLNFSYPIPAYPSFKLRFGVLYGVTSYHYNIMLTELFRPSGSVHRMSYMYTLGYPGLTLGGSCILISSENSNLSLNANISAVYFLSNFYEFGIPPFPTDPNRNIFFSSEFYINESNKILFVPDLELSFSKKLGKRFNLEVNMRGAWSKGYIMRSFPDYKIIGAQDTLTGTYQKQFKYIGLGFGITYNLK